MLRLGKNQSLSVRPYYRQLTKTTLWAMMGKCDSIAIQEWLKKRYSLLFLRINERTDHAFAIVDLPYPPLNPVDQPFDCKISISTPRQAESDFLRMSDFEEGTTFFDSKGWEKRLLEISRR